MSVIACVSRTPGGVGPAHPPSNDISANAMKAGFMAILRKKFVAFLGNAFYREFYREFIEC
jgi:hypothetical protein